MALDDSYFNPQPYKPVSPWGTPSSLTGSYPQFDTKMNLPSLGDRQIQTNYFGPQAKERQGLSSLMGSAGQIGGLLAKTGVGKKALAKTAGGLVGKFAAKGGILGKLAAGSKGNPTPWGLGGAAAGILGDAISKKHAKTGGFIGGAGKGAALGATIGSVIPGIGTAIGGVAGGLIGGIKGLFSGKKKNKEKKAAEAAAKAAEGLQGRGAVASDPYGQLRAETEARYAQPQFDYMGSYNKLMSNFPAAGGQDYVKYSQQKAEPYYTGEGMGGLSTFGG